MISFYLFIIFFSGKVNDLSHRHMRIINVKGPRSRKRSLTYEINMGQRS